MSANRIKADKRRPAGVSRRHKRQFAFETLEARQVMSASSPLAALAASVNQQLALETQSYSSATAEGQLQILLNEMQWQSLVSASRSSASGNVTTLSIPSDPFLDKQWHLVNLGQAVGSPDWQPIYGVPGQDINVAPVWNMGLTGSGVKVAVLDSGVQTNHPDLAANISPTLGFDAIEPGSDGNPVGVILNPLNAHGTAVAGLIAAVANNGIGGAGVAPGATIVPIRLIDAGATNQSFVDAFRYALQNGVDITSNSWGFALARGLVAPSPEELLAVRDSILFGRNGLGVIHVFSSGNDGGVYGDRPGFPGTGIFDSSQYDGYANSRYVIAVGGVDHDGFYNNIDGTVTNYPEAGANVLVSAPTGSVALQIGLETDIGSGMFTTDVTGDPGFNAEADPNTGQEVNDPFYPAGRDFFPDGDYTSRFNGTSAAAPLVSGEIALMLEANPNLSWRDVKEILVRSARQNAEFEIPSNGFGQLSQNLWIINQQPLFRDPDLWPIATDPLTATFAPITTVPDNGMFSNGAGYTVSQGYGVYGEQLGYGHGVIDVELAVQMAQQWSNKDQTLAPELTFTTYVVPSGNAAINIPAAQRSNNDSSNQFVPGGIGGVAQFIDYWEEYFEDDPFSGNNPPINDRGTFATFAVPPSNTMSVETVEVKLTITGDAAEFLNHARVVLVSPSGTHSELNHYYYDPPAPSIVQTLVPGSFSGSPGSNPTSPLIWSFSTNRSWGERSDGIWQLHIENYDSNNAFGLQGVEIDWHGSPIGANTQRLMGFVGVDENRDDVFQFSRLAETPEDWARNVTVSLRRASDNVLVDQFVVGHDGNFYFDVVPDNYIMTVEDPLGRTAVDDSINATPQYLSVWNLTPADFAAVTNEGFNFLLDPGPPVAQQAVFTGEVFADVDGDGIYNKDDVNLSNQTVFNDANRNGQRDAGEATTLTDANGQYTLTVPITAATVVNVAIRRPTQWTSTQDGPGAGDSATDGLESFFVRPGDAVSDVIFGIKPPANNIGGGGATQPGILVGVVYEDVNGNATRNVGELGAANVTVYLDNNNSGVPDAGDQITVTNEHGAYAFTQVAPGQRLIRIVIPSPLTQTTPAPGTGRLITLTGSSTVSNIQFGIKNSALLDFGDLPAIYGATLLAENGARHTKGSYWLGPTIDTELNGHPSPNADGDDLFAPQMDEDGITFGSIVPGQTASLVATASRANGVLQGWVDWNNDGDFNDVGERIISNKALIAGPNTVTFAVPAGANVNQVYARFRYGENQNGPGGVLRPIGTPFGLADLGEVEDYQLNVAVPVTQQITNLPGDADGDHDVDGNDFLAWQRNVGRTQHVVRSMGDANGDQQVNGADLGIWKQNYGESATEATAAAATASTTPAVDGDVDGDVDGNDFLSLQRQPLNSTSIAAWKDLFGQTGEGAAPAMAFAAAGLSAQSDLLATNGDADSAKPSTDNAAVRALSGRPFIDLASRIEAKLATASTRGAAGADSTSDGSSIAWDLAAEAASRRDRAFDDLFGSRRRQGLQADVEVEQSGDEAECDAVFAAMADHFERPLG